MMAKQSEATTASLCVNVVASACCWSALYLFLVWLKPYRQSPECFCRIVTVAHALLVITLGVTCYWQGPHLIDSPGEPNTVMQDATLSASLGYFLYDLVWCVCHQTESMLMIVHHIASVLSISVVLFGRASGAEAVAGILSLELSNPLLQLRWFLRTAGLQGSVAHTATELLFVLVFVVLRLGAGSAITYAACASPKVTLAVKVCTVTLYLISLAFIMHIALFMRRKYSKKSRSN